VLVQQVVAKPNKPSCPFDNCLYLWTANYVPSLSASSFNFYLDSTAVAQNVPYGEELVTPLYCNTSLQTTDERTHLFAVGPSTQVGAGNPFSFEVVCDHLFAFFASRAPNINNNEAYTLVLRDVEGNPSFGYESGLIFNGVYRGGTINAKYCDWNSAICNADRLDTRNNLNVPANTINEMSMKALINPGNPVTITGFNNTLLFDGLVSGAVGDSEVWVFYGDAKDQADFPIMGGQTFFASSSTGGTSGTGGGGTGGTGGWASSASSASSGAGTAAGTGGTGTGTGGDSGDDGGNGDKNGASGGIWFTASHCGRGWLMIKLAASTAGMALVTLSAMY